MPSEQPWLGSTSQMDGRWGGSRSTLADGQDPPAEIMHPVLTYVLVGWSGQRCVLPASGQPPS